MLWFNKYLFIIVKMITDDQARIISAMIVAIPLSYAIPRIPSQLGR